MKKYKVFRMEPEGLWNIYKENVIHQNVDKTQSYSQNVRLQIRFHCINT